MKYMKSHKLSIPSTTRHGGTVNVKKATKPPKLRFKPGTFVQHQGERCEVIFAYRLQEDPHEWIFCVEHHRDRKTTELTLAVDALAKRLKLGENTPRIAYELFRDGSDAHRFFSDIPMGGDWSSVSNKTLLKENK